MIIRNAARCTRCNTIIESKYRHEFVSCSCGAIFVDGGKDYIRYGGDMSVFESLFEQDDKKSGPCQCAAILGEVECTCNG